MCRRENVLEKAQTWKEMKKTLSLQIFWKENVLKRNHHLDSKSSQKKKYS